MFCFIIDYSKVGNVKFLRLSNYLNNLRICIKPKHPQHNDL